MQANAALTGENDIPTVDLGPLSWVLDELRKSLEGATKALRRFVRDAELARGSDLAALDASQLRIARQQLHQAVGALEMVGMVEPAKVLRAMEALAQNFVQRPELCSDEAALKVERASFALTEYLEGVIKGKTASSVALFPQYRDVLALVGDDRIHPADLWPFNWRWLDVTMPQVTAPLNYDASRTLLDWHVLKVVKSGDAAAAHAMRDISLGFAAAQSALEPRVFWKICAAYFEAVALGLCPTDIYGKRAASRILLQSRTLAKDDAPISERLLQDLLFFCAQAIPVQVANAPVLSAVRAAYGLTQTKPVDYETPQFGRFDPALLVQARKRIAAATETWSALSGGDTNRLKVASDQFSLVTDSVLKLHPECGDLVRALSKAIETTARSGEAPPPALAMEVATVVLYLEAAYEDLDPTDSQMAQRSASLAHRLEHANAGGKTEPLEGWMEDLYRRVSDRQIMGSVVDELRTNLGTVEKSLDLFFRNPLDKLPLHEVPSQLAQMRGVFSVLGLDQAALATLRLRSSVEKFLQDDFDAVAARTGIFEKLGNSLGALGFLIDMLSYQRELAKKLFVYDEELGEFKPLMGRQKSDEVVAPVEVPPVPEVEVVVPVLVPPPVLAPAAAPAPAPALEDDDERELRDIFLEEAREVVQNGLAAIRELVADPSDLAHQTTLRRSFHTLKGSARMVGLHPFGEAGWAMEQLLNAWLAEQKPASDALLQLTHKAMNGLGRWVEDIATGQDARWDSMAFRKAADGLRLEHQVLELVLPDEVVSAPEVVPAPKPAPLAEPVPVFVPEPVPEPEPLPESEPERIAEAVPETEAEPETESIDELELDFLATAMFDFDAIELVNPSTPQVARTETPEAAVELPVDLLDFDFMGAPEVEALVIAEPVAAEPFEAEATESLSFDLGEVMPEPEPAEEPAAEPEPEPEIELQPEPDVLQPDLDDQVKVIGSLRIDIPLYNVYLNEADEWSRRLLTELNEWALELPRPMSDASLIFAHSLTGSSATIGFFALSEMARSLEQAMEHVQLYAQNSSEHATVFVAAAEDIRRLLHQFAAGFLKEPNQAILSELKTILETEFPPAVELVEESAYGALPEFEPESESDFEFDFEFEPEPEPEPETEAEPEPSPAIPEPAVSVLADADQEAEIEALDVLDVDLFPIFEEEALELMPQLGGALRQWVARPENLGARSEVLRVLHTLKGSSRLAGAMHLGEMTHRLESVIENLGSESLQTAQLEPLLSRFDAIHDHFDQLRDLPEQALSLPEASPVAEVLDAEQTTAQAIVPSAGPLAPLALIPSAVALTPARPVANQTVRVRSQLLDRLVNQAGEVMMSRSRLEARLGQLRGSLVDLTANLDRLRSQLRDIEVQSESQMQTRLAQAKDSAQGFDPLEFDRFTRVQELTRMMAESVHDVATVQRSLQRTVEGTEDDLIAQARQARELQRDLLRTRMVEFEGISERLYGVVRQAAKDAGKPVKLELKGGSLEMDRGVLERMAPVFEHLLRNAVGHGIEDAAQRVKAGKPATGTITVQLHQQSNDVTVEISDDGGGLDLNLIREKALLGGKHPDTSAMTDAELANLIFAPGFSTAAKVTELSGRGIGLDVVRSEVNALGGRIETSTQPGLGTQFKLVLPLTTAVTQVVMLRMGELVTGVPANLVEMVRRVPVADLERAYQTRVFDFGDEKVPFFWAGALLQSSACSSETRTKTLPVAIFRSAGQRVAMHVDEVLGNQEVVVKNLGPQLSRLPGLTGMSVLASGAVVLIYNPVALVTVYGAQARQLMPVEGQVGIDQAALSTLMARATLAPLVLVVDDSITVRRVTQRLLKREGFRVALANDGLQALERLQEEKPAVVLSDIEMPRMDGFDLARNIRGDEQLKDLPIIMITSRIADKHREHARELGVDHYLGKPYSEDELIGLVRQYCALPINS